MEFTFYKNKNFTNMVEIIICKNQDTDINFLYQKYSKYAILRT